MPTTEQILSAAQTIRTRLDELLGADAETVANQLDQWLAAPESEAVKNDIVKLLSQYQPTRQELKNLLSAAESAERNYTQLSGDPSRPVATSEYICPNQQGCTCGEYRNGWDRLSIEDTIPTCPKKNQPLILKSPQ